MGEIVMRGKWRTKLICHGCGARFVEAEYVLCHLCDDRAVGDDAFRAHTDKLREDKKLWFTLPTSLVDFDPYMVARDHKALDKIRPTIQTPGGIRAEREAALKQKQDLQAANQRKDVLDTLKATLKVQSSRALARPSMNAEEAAHRKLSGLPLIDVLKTVLDDILDDDQCKALSDHLTASCSSEKPRGVPSGGRVKPIVIAPPKMPVYRGMDFSPPPEHAESQSSSSSPAHY